MEIKMMEHFERALSYTVRVEGGFVDDPRDSGGATRFGITEAVARRHGYAGPMKELPAETAKAIYRADYWDPLKLAAVAHLAPRVADEMFDAAVNVGTLTVARWFQRALNALNDGGERYPDVEVDGQIGPTTLGAFRVYMEWRKHPGERVMVALLNCLQGAYYLDLAERRPKDERFMFGWVLQRVVEGAV